MGKKRKLTEMRQAELDSVYVALAKTLEKEAERLGVERLGFSLVVMREGMEPGYISNVEAADAIREVRRCIDRVERNKFRANAGDN